MVALFFFLGNVPKFRIFVGEIISNVENKFTSAMFPIILVMSWRPPFKLAPRTTVRVAQFYFLLFVEFILKFLEDGPVLHSLWYV